MKTDSKKIKKHKKVGRKVFPKYLLFFFGAIVYWEMIMNVKLGGITLSSFAFLLFAPAQALFLTALAGIGNEKSARITFPLIVALPAIYYGAQTVYMKSMGSLFSVSMIKMGKDVVGNFGWTLVDVLKKSVPSLILIMIPVAIAIFLSIKNVWKLKEYKWWKHPVALILVAAVWMLGVLAAKLWGTDRLSPYYMLTSTSATTDSSAKKIGTLTTGIAEFGSYYFGIRDDSADKFTFDTEEQEIERPVKESLDLVDAYEDATDTPEVENADIEEEEEVQSRPWINEQIDFASLADGADDEDVKMLATYLDSRSPSYTNEYTGMFEGYNLIYICAESFWNYACDEKVTPTLYKMAHNGIVLKNYYNSFYNTTTNGEFALDTSLWPDVSRHSSNGTDVGSFAQSASKYMPQGLGDLFTAQGVPSYAFHNYYGKYYRRILSWPNLGYDCKFTGDDGMWFTSNWPASDLELMEQTVDDYISDPQFHAYYMTFSGHGPYTDKNYMYNKNIGDVRAIEGTEQYSDMAQGYLAGELELDRAMEYLLSRLEEAGVADKTVIVIAGDHYPYYMDKDARDSLALHEMDETFEIYRSNCIIYNAGMSEPVEVDNYCCNVDIAPTILNLFNIPFESRLMMGRDIFSDVAHNRATIYNKSFVTELVKYDYDSGTCEWSSLADSLSEEQKNEYIDTQLNSIENEYTAACKIIEENFFLYAYEKSGLLTEEEVKEELARENNVKALDSQFNDEDAAKEAEREAEKQAQQEAAETENPEGEGTTEEGDTQE